MPIWKFILRGDLWRWETEQNTSLRLFRGLSEAIEDAMHSGFLPLDHLWEIHGASSHSYFEPGKLPRFEKD